MNQPTELLTKLSTQIIERENQKAAFEINYATQSKDIDRLAKFLHAEIIDAKTEDEGLIAIAEAIRTGRYGKVDHIEILNFNGADNKPVIVKVYTDKSETFPIPLIVIFNGLNINPVVVITELQFLWENDTDYGREKAWGLEFGND